MMELNTDPSDEEMQVLLNNRGQAFKRVMPLAMRNLAIAQHTKNRDTSWSGEGAGTNQKPHSRSVTTSWSKGK